MRMQGAIFDMDGVLLDSMPFWKSLLDTGERVTMDDERVRRFYAQEAQAKPDVEKFLSLLKMEGVWMYVATNTERVHAEAALTRLGLRDYFRGILTCSEAGAKKNNPLIYEKCLTRLRCRKEACVVFEDALYAIRTAKAAGFRVAAVYDGAFGEDPAEIRALADYEITSFTDWIEKSKGASSPLDGE